MDSEGNAKNLGYISDNTYLITEDTIGTIIIKWKDKEERLELKPRK